ncbi:MAG: TMEM165/GDT1 family protein, partial [Planctomycetes bacterium]|nr:TMEM165/GDT1 family protein [Planctomycetota bacterium]
MDFRIMIATFGAVFLAELGDKTQLATFCLATNKCPWSVFTGSAVALVIASLLAVLVGCHLQKLDIIPVIWIKRSAAILFLIMGSYMLLST